MDFSGYNVRELKDAVSLDPYAVRDEAYLRSGKLAKQIQAAKSKLSRLQADYEECGKAILAVSQHNASVAA